MRPVSVFATGPRSGIEQLEAEQPMREHVSMVAVAAPGGDPGPSRVELRRRQT
jgi:hypothetical protein